MRRINAGLTRIAWPGALLLLLGACDYRDFDSSERYQSDFHYTYALNPGGRLQVDNFNGPVEITGWDRANCDISGSKYASTAELRDGIKIEVNHSANLIYIRSVRPDGGMHGNVVGNMGGNMGVRYVIHVPRKTELSPITSSNGSIHIEEVDGLAELKTSNGAIHVNSLRGELSARSSNGSLTTENISGAMDLHTSNGPIRAEHVMAGIAAVTSNGSITVHFDANAPASTIPLKFETNNGRIDISMDSPPKSEVRARTSNSGITMRLPANSSMKVRAATTHGQVQSDFRAGDAQAEEHGRRQTLEENIGSGGPLIDLHTSNGSIRLLRM